MKKISNLILSSLVVPFVLSCSSKPSNDHRPASASEKGPWGPNVSLRAPLSTYSNFPHVMMRPEPSADGWWIAPIHATLLPSGDVLITGWARPAEHSCPSHMGRQWPASFVVHISPDQDIPQGTQAGELFIQPIEEKGDKVGGSSPKDPLDVLYCSGHAPLPDGRVLFTGGARYVDLEFNKFGENGSHEFEDEYGLNYARIFNPATSSFERVAKNFPDGPDLAEIKRIETAFPGKPSRDWGAIYEKGMMWYPTNLRLPDGRQLVAGGFARQSGPFDPQFINRSLLIFDPKHLSTNPWSVLVPHVDLGKNPKSPSQVLDLAGFDYVHLFLLPKPLVVKGQSYEVALWGGVKSQFGFLTLDPKVPVSKRIYIPPSGPGVGPTRPLGAKGEVPGGSDTTGVLLETGEIVIVGGGSDGREGGQRIDVYNPYTNKWRTPIYTGVSRIRAASILLPTGEVLIVNGEESYTANSNIGDRRQPILFNPKTGEIKLLSAWANDDSDRGYHNFAILLKDGRVLLGGGRELVKDAHTGLDVHRIGCEKPDLRIYSPPYLARGPRPMIESKNPIVLKISGAGVDLPFAGEALKTSQGVVLMALPSETHHFDQNQRMVSLAYQIREGHIHIDPPKTNLSAPLGQYTMYFLSASNVPSEGVSVEVVP